MTRLFLHFWNVVLQPLRWRCVECARRTAPHIYVARIGGGTGGGAHGPRLPHFYFWGGLSPPLFFLNIVSVSNTISIGSSDKENHSM